MNYKKSLGLRIKELRKSKKLSQEQLAEKIDLEPPSVCNIENGKNYPSLQNMEKIVNVLGVSFVDIFQFEHQKQNEDLVKEINRFLKDNPDKIKYIYKITKALCE